jgi:hypothetical protein
MFENAQSLSGSLDYSARNPDHGCTFGDRMDDHRSRSDLDVVPQSDIA